MLCIHDNSPIKKAGPVISMKVRTRQISQNVGNVHEKEQLPSHPAEPTSSNWVITNILGSPERYSE